MSLEVTKPSLFHRATQAVGWGIIRATARASVEGRDRFPAAGPYIVVINHLDFVDVAIFHAMIPHRFAGFAAQHWVDHRLVGPIINLHAELLPVRAGHVDHRTLGRAVRWLQAGGVLMVAPEGTRARNGALQRGNPGAAYLACRTGVPVVPAVSWGQETWWASVRRLRRIDLSIRVGEPFTLAPPAPDSRAEDLEAATEEIMVRIAALLPQDYRGVYTAATDARGL